MFNRIESQWWNPINHFRHQLEAKPIEIEEDTSTKRVKLADIEWTPDTTAFWAEGVGKGGENPWKFNCKCGEKCSSYEKYLYHPTGIDCYNSIVLIIR